MGDGWEGVGGVGVCDVTTPKPLPHHAAFCPHTNRRGRARLEKTDFHVYVYICVGGLGGESNREIVSFRFVRTCVRARGLAAYW